MKLLVNGEAKEYEDVSSLAELIDRLGIKKEGSAAELNGKILRQDEWQGSGLKDGDKVEIITFVGGG